MTEMRPFGHLEVDMNLRLAQAWMAAGSPPLSDLAPLLNMSDIELIRYMSGRKFPDQGTQQLLAQLFGKKVSDLFG
jgi:hypothetical protein